MTERWKKAALYIAGGWNVLGGVTALADPERHFSQLYRAALPLDQPVPAFFFRATWINVIAWGLGYILAARSPAARAPVLLAGASGKLAYFVACLALFTGGGGTTTLLALSALDLVFAGLFVAIVWGRALPVSRG